MNRSTIALVAGAGLLTACAIYMGFDHQLQSKQEAQIAPAPAEITSTSAAAGGAGMAPLANAAATTAAIPPATGHGDAASRPAWLDNPGSTAGGSSAQAGAGIQGMAARDARMDMALRRMQQLQAANVTDPKQINDVLLQIEQANGSPVMQGVRLDVLRHNLVIADKMKTIAEGLQADTLSAANTSPGGSRTISVQARLDQLELLRKQLRMDIVVTPTAPLPVPPAPLAQSRLQ